MEPEYLGVPVLRFQDFRILVLHSKILECVDFETFNRVKVTFEHYSFLIYWKLEIDDFYQIVEYQHLWCF